MDIKYKKSALKFLRTMDKNIAIKIASSIDGLKKIPPEGDIKALQGKENLYRLRVGKYRIIYTYIDNSLIIIDIGSRGDIYK